MRYINLIWIGFFILRLNFLRKRFVLNYTQRILEFVGIFTNFAIGSKPNSQIVRRSGEASIFNLVADWLETDLSKSMDSFFFREHIAGCRISFYLLSWSFLITWWLLHHFLPSCILMGPHVVKDILFFLFR